jgi:hypothetical protein
MSTPFQRGTELNTNAIDFLRIEISLANTFMDVSRTSNVLANQRQGRLSAEKAYRCASRLLLQVQLTANETFEFERGMTALKARLVASGIAGRAV